MKQIIILIGILNIVYGAKYNGLRVKFGWSSALEDKEYFFKIPRTLKEAEEGGWKRTERPPGPIPELKLYCPQGRYVCPLYESAGFIAGLQLSFPVDEFAPLPTTLKPEVRFVKWRAPATDSEGAREYWTTTQYYVSDESLKAGSGPQIENGATLQDGGVWVNGLDRKLMRIPISEVELNNTDFKKQNCIPNMGTHYYYNMTPELQCENTLPWFVLTSGGVMVGTGLQLFGKMVTPPNQRDWFERPPPRAAQIIVPFAPPCVSDWFNNYGVVALHIYYVEKPWKIRCTAGDSIRSIPILDRFLLNGQRYSSQVVDELKKAFSGYI